MCQCKEVFLNIAASTLQIALLLHELALKLILNGEREKV
jgi:hypothetical protein